MEGRTGTDMPTVRSRPGLTIVGRVVEHGDAESLRLHLLADISYQQGLVRFLENHDAPRTAFSFSADKAPRAAAVTVLTLPGAKLLHEGQFEGRRIAAPQP
jgi:hypothetical protein